MKYKHIQVTIGTLGLLLIPINVYFDGHFLTNISMILLSLGMGVGAYSLHSQEKKTGSVYLRKINLNRKTYSFFFMTLALGGVGVFFALKWWILFTLSLLIVILFGVMWFKEINKIQKL